MKNPLAFAMLAALALAVGYTLYVSIQASPPVNASYSGPAQLCRDGTTQYCKAGECAGVSTCINGVWAGCKWETICTPGTRQPCLRNGCSYAVKECNECGTGYGECSVQVN